MTGDGREQQELKRGVEVPFPISLLFIPILMVAVVLSFPIDAISKAIERRKERRFASEMAEANRVMSWPLFVASLQEKRGTLIVEALSSKGPSRWWWTSDDIAIGSPYTFAKRGVEAVFDFDGEFDAASRWCHEMYTGPKGRALFVLSGAVPGGARDDAVCGGHASLDINAAGGSGGKCVLQSRRT